MRHFFGYIFRVVILYIANIIKMPGIFKPYRPADGTAGFRIPCFICKIWIFCIAGSGCCVLVVAVEAARNDAINLPCVKTFQCTVGFLETVKAHRIAEIIIFACCRDIRLEILVCGSRKVSCIKNDRHGRLFIRQGIRIIGDDIEFFRQSILDFIAILIFIFKFFYTLL